MGKPEILMMDNAGYHNNDMEASRTRLIKGGSWKKQRVIVVLPASDTISTKVMLSHWNLAFPPNNGVVKIITQNMEVGDAYSTAIEGILADPVLSTWEFLCVLEHDNCPPSDGVIKLIEVLETHPEFAAVSGAYWTKGYSGVFQAWGNPNEPLNFMPQLPDPNGGLVECCGIGMGFALFRLEIFKDTRLRRPWFHTQKKDGVSTQDLYFWSDARKFGYRCCVDCSCKVGHYDALGSFSPTPDFMW